MQRLAAISTAAALFLGCGSEHEGQASGGNGGTGAEGFGGSAAHSGTAGSAGIGGSTADTPGVYRIDPASSATLGPFDQMIGEASIVALGESVHTSGGYARFKSDLVRHLIAARGFRVIALETPRTDAARIDEFVKGCQGSLVEAMKGMFWVFADEHMAELLDWTCQWNQSHPEDRVSFVGFDVQQPWHDGPALAAFLQSSTTPGAAALADGIESCDGTSAGSSDAYHGAGGFEQPISASEFAECSAATDAIADYFATNQAALIAEAGERELAFAKLALLGVSSWERSKYLLASDPMNAYQARDAAMATVLSELLRLDHPERRAVMWAHNFHIRQASQSSEAYPMGVVCTGTWLHQALGDDYVAFGFASSRTWTNWPGVSCGLLPAPGPNDLESVLEGLGEPSLLVDLDNPALERIAPGERYGFGLNAGGEVAVPAEQYRGLIWLSESPAMVSVFGPTPCVP